ncbi:MAG: hypothetical protein KAG99_10740, partial [Bacteroidales bacterium]|nr:hypothetical protein [Bacteroidales bacterium]
MLVSLMYAQPAYKHVQRKAYTITSGMHEGPSDPTMEAISVFCHTIKIDRAPWIRLYFGECNLSRNSYMTVTSAEDNGQQRLNSRSLNQWRNASAFFNGDEVYVELFAAPGDHNVFFEIKEVVVGIRGSYQGTRSICGGSDNRVLSYDDAVGRSIKIIGTDSSAWCTVWIVSNGAHLTAGHCTDPYELEAIEFNIPLSDPDGTANFSDPDDQYSVIDASVDANSNGLGDDWAVFNV